MDDERLNRLEAAVDRNTDHQAETSAELKKLMEQLAPILEVLAELYATTKLVKRAAVCVLWIGGLAGAAWGIIRISEKL